MMIIYTSWEREEMKKMKRRKKTFNIKKITSHHITY